MKSNNLLEGINTDIKIEKGLKILEFGAQFYLHRTYLRNCPLIRNDDEEPNIEKQQKDAIIIAQLNQFLINPTSSQSKVQIQKVALQLISKTNHKITMINSQEKVTNNSLPFQTTGRKKGPQQSTKGQVDNSSPGKIAKGASMGSAQAGKKEQMKASLVKKISKISSPFQKQKNVTIQQHTQSISASDLTSSIQSLSSSSKSLSYSYKGSRDNSKQELKESDLLSYYSDAKPMTIIKQANQSLQSGSRQILPFKKDNKVRPQGYNLSDFLSIRDQPSVGNSTLLPKQTKYHKQYQGTKINKSIQAEIKSQNNSFLNKSISRIKQSNEKSFVSEHKANQTQLNLLKEISDSFCEEEKIKHLMKLENFQLEEKFLLQRMEKRFQSCANNISSIRSISWSSLKMPQTQIIFKRPDYAHCLDRLQ